MPLADRTLRRVATRHLEVLRDTLIVKKKNPTRDDLAHLVAFLQSENAADSSSAADACWHLTRGVSRDLEERRSAIAAAGAIPPLVELLKRAPGADSNAAGALQNLACGSEERCAAIAAAGAIPPLIELLQRAPADSDAAKWAAGALENLMWGSEERKAAAAIADAMVSLSIVAHAFPRLCDTMKSCFLPSLRAAVVDTDRAALAKAIDRAAVVMPHGDADLVSARTRLAKLEEEERQREFCTSTGLSIKPPAQFECPITMDVMIDPVVASDGHTYEREAIEGVLRSANPRSPLTRDNLTTELRPNRALRNLIQEHAGWLFQQAKSVAAQQVAAGKRAAPEADGGESAKRHCRA
jgi:hypothetical protein